MEINESNIIKLTDYIYKTFDNSTDANTVIERLLLLDTNVLTKLFEQLVQNNITKLDLYSLPAITNETINTLLDRVSLGSNEILTVKRYYKDIHERSFNFTVRKNSLFSDFKTYVMNSMIQGESYCLTPKYDMLNVNIAYVEYTRLVNAYSPTIKNNIKCMDLYNRFKAIHNNFEFRNKYLLELIDLSINKPLFINSPFNRERLINYQPLVDLLNKNYKFVSTITFDKIYDDILNNLAKNTTDYTDYGWTLIQSKVKEYSWSDLSSKRLTFFKDYQEYKIMLLFYPLLFNRLDEENLYATNKKIENSFVEYFESARDVLVSVMNLVNTF